MTSCTMLLYWIFFICFLVQRSREGTHKESTNPLNQIMELSRDEHGFRHLGLSASTLLFLRFVKLFHFRLIYCLFALARQMGIANKLIRRCFANTQPNSTEELNETVILCATFRAHSMCAHTSVDIKLTKRKRQGNENVKHVRCVFAVRKIITFRCLFVRSLWRRWQRMAAYTNQTWAKKTSSVSLIW